ncbi:hypothetical protein Fmac_029914 [Flemingia macrophylla]|uniref:Uncharacterized protein n=1 Tax=Flemingia macrophylla TaxID=520843 RepID=A0ABD1LDB1_9FABA
MGRKRASKTNDKAHVMPSGENIHLSGTLNSQREVPLPLVIPMKHPIFMVDGVETHHEKSPAQVNQESGHEKKSPAFFSRKKSKFHGASVRRSERIKNAVVSPPNNNYGIEYIEDITVSENDKDEADTQMEQALVEPELEVPESESEPEPEQAEMFSEKKSLDKKVDCVFQRIEALDKIVRLLKSKIDEKFDFYEAPSMASSSYRSMYIDSQKKIEALTAENQRLNGKLENALGKIEVYEKEIRVLIDALDKTKDAVNAAVISNLAKTIEAAVSVSTQAIHNACPASAAKRKRNES